MARFLLVRALGLKLAIPLGAVRELADLSRLTGPRSREGGGESVALGGEEVPLITGRWLGWTPRGDSGAAEALVVLEEKGLTAGLLADKITGIRGEPAVTGRELPAMLSSRVEGITGLLEGDDGLYLVLDAAEAVARARREPDEDAARPHSEEEGSVR